MRRKTEIVVEVVEKKRNKNLELIKESKGIYREIESEVDRKSEIERQQEVY